jgi:hypothetical protein
MRPPEAEAVDLLICDDIRLEASGRLSLMGVYGPTVEVASFPFLLPSLCAVLLIRKPREPLTTATSVVLDMTGNPMFPAGTQTLSPPTVTGTKLMYQLQVKMVPFILLAEGTITFRFTFDGSDQIGMELPITVRRTPGAS